MPDPETTDAGPEPASYAEATAELEAILAEIEDDSVDVDVLTRKVARAALLIRWCRGRIDGARVDVERIVAEIDPEP
ncbi:MAG TPA: exodeoxyribonuclease VII small subunit [Acidimicrobiales bacterium]|nr:exodeoxyribonuclease VII small subunit [Acidimicrobiales bacterium]